MEAVRINYGPTHFEPLAQGAGSYSFHIDPEGRYWSVRGNRETGHAAVKHGPDIALQVPGDRAEVLREIAETGIVIDSAATLAVSPIVGLYKQLAPGDYRLTVYAGSAAGYNSCKVRLGTERNVSSRIRVNPTNGRFLRIECRGSDENRWCSIHEITTDALDREAQQKVSASANVSGYPASAAVDGDANTRWAAEGDHWIQVPLDPGRDLKEIDISWYQAETREYKYALQVSHDGRVWKDLAIQPVSTSVHGRTHVLKNTGRQSAAVSAIDMPIHLAKPALPQLRVVPVDGTVIVYGLELELSDK
jgi:hypothetical protein